MGGGGGARGGGLQIRLTVTGAAHISIETWAHEADARRAVGHECVGVQGQALLAVLLLTVQPRAVFLQDGRDAHDVLQVPPGVGQLLDQVGRLVELTAVHLHGEEHVQLGGPRHGLDADDAQTVLLLREDGVAQGSAEAVHVQPHEVLGGRVLEADGDGVLQYLMHQLLHVHDYVDGHLKAAVAHRHVQHVLSAVQAPQGDDLPVVTVHFEQALLLRFQRKGEHIIHVLVRGMDLPNDPTRKVVLHGDDVNLQWNGRGLVDTFLDDPHADVGVGDLLGFSRIFCLKQPGGRKARNSERAESLENQSNLPRRRLFLYPCLLLPPSPAPVWRNCRGRALQEEK